MLQINNAVKNLFRSDSVKKNLRIHFPNGERADITNENIVGESLSFEESICSTEEIKFGLCEASVLEFDTADVENIEGAVITASIEINTNGATFEIPTLNENGFYSFETLPELGTGTPSGSVFRIRTDGNAKLVNIQWSGASASGSAIRGGINLDNATEYTYTQEMYELWYLSVYTDNESVIYIDAMSDIYASIPLGDFIVTESYRNSGFFSKRRNTACGVGFDYLNNFSSVELAKRNLTCQYDVPYEFDAWKYSYSNIKGLSNIPEEILTRVEVHTYSANYNNTFRVSGYSFNIANDEQAKMLYKVFFSEFFSLEELREQVLERFSGEDLDVFNFYEKEIFYPRVSYHGAGNYSFDGIVESNSYIYPYASSGLDYSEHSVALYFPCAITNVPGDFPTPAFDVEFRGTPILYTVETNRPEIMLRLEREMVNGYYSVANKEAYKPIEVIQSLLELQGLFGRYDRYGEFQFVGLAGKFGLYPSEELYPSEDLYPQDPSGGVYEGEMFTEVWHDDYPHKPYGKIVATYTNEYEEVVTMEKNIIKERDAVINKELIATADITSVSLEIDVSGLITRENILVESDLPLLEASVMAYRDPTAPAWNEPIDIKEGQKAFECSIYGINLADTISLRFDATNYSGTVRVYQFDRASTWYGEGEFITYDLSDNELLKTASIPTEIMAELLDSMAENIKEISYMPSEIDMKGLPYLEAGDVIQLYSRYIGFQTIVLRRTMTGIQSLHDAIESK